MSSRALLEENLNECLGRIAGAQGNGSTTLIAVTKSVAPELALALASLGIRDLGESRVQAFEGKLAAFAAAGREVRWHFLGHLQRNKARKVVQNAYALHSLDSLRLLETIGRLREELGRAPLLFLQVKLNDEAAKSGFPPDELPAALERARALGLEVLGLMSMAPLVPAPEQRAAARTTFRRLVALGRSLPGNLFVQGRPLYSMGMSEDFEEAVAEGADFVRIGSALFRGLSCGDSGPVADRIGEGSPR